MKALGRISGSQRLVCVCVCVVMLAFECMAKVRLGRTPSIVQRWLYLLNIEHLRLACCIHECTSCSRLTGVELAA